MFNVWRPGSYSELVAKCEWSQVELPSSEFGCLTLMRNWPPWVELTNETMKVIDAAKMVNQLSKPLVQPYSQTIAGYIAEHYEKIAKRDTKVILIGKRDSGPFTIIDGAHKSISIALYRDVLNKGELGDKRAYFGLIASPIMIQY